LSEYFNCLLRFQKFDKRKGLDVCVTLLRETKKIQQVLEINAYVRRAQIDFSGAFDRVIRFGKIGQQYWLVLIDI
jgi:hypothetical protein